jgi:outer membrane protein OmpA-like peptidoglycan-associated protein
MNSKAMLTLAVFAGWCLLSSWWYHSVHCNCVAVPGVPANNAVNTAGSSFNYPPYYFRGANGKTVNTSENFARFADSVKGSFAGNERLTVTGYWYAGEDTAGIGDLGLYRANQLKNALTAYVPADKIDAVSRFVDQSMNDSIFAGATIVKSIQPVMSKDSTTSLVMDGKLIVYFPSNSTKNTFDSQTEKNINDIVALASSGKTITISGHTDNQGDDAKNMTLSLNRANKLRDLLIVKGVKAKQIKTVAKGETEPIATNDTPEGRALNRRAEVTTEQ